MSDRQQQQVVDVRGSLGHLCLTDRDCLAKQATCSHSGTRQDPPLASTYVLFEYLTVL